MVHCSITPNEMLKKVIRDNMSVSGTFFRNDYMADLNKLMPIPPEFLMLADSIVHEYDQIPNLKFGDKYFLGIAQVVKMKIKPLLNSWFNHDINWLHILILPKMVL